MEGALSEYLFTVRKTLSYLQDSNFLTESASKKNEHTMIGGWDSIVKTTEKPVVVICRFLEGIRKMWPQLQVIINEDQALPPGKLPQVLPPEEFVHIIRDDTMRIHEIEEGATLMEDGEGVVSIWYFDNEEEVHEITIVTPEDPDSDPFSKKIFEHLKISCRDKLIEAHVLKGDLYL